MASLLIVFACYVVAQGSPSSDISDDLTSALPSLRARTELQCDASDDEYIQDIVAAMLDQGYNVETALLSFGTQDISANVSAFQVPFFNVYGVYGSSLFNTPFGVAPATRFSGCDIMLLRGCTPPTSTYFSYRSYLTARLYDATSLDTEVFGASLGDSLNDQVMVTESATNTKFDSITNIATTGDKQSFYDLQAAYISAGLSPSSLNLDSVPIESNFIYSEDATSFPRDTLSVLFRVANDGEVSNKTQALLNQYYNQTQLLYVFRCAASNNTPRVPIPADLRDTIVPQQKAENTMKNEKLFENVVNETKQEFVGARGYELVSETQFIAQNAVVDGDKPVYIFEHGFWCLQNGVDCIFDNRDAYYSWDATTHTLTDDDLYIVVGLDHTRYQMTRYNGVGLYYVTDPINPDYLFTPLPPPNSMATNDEYEEYDIEDVIGCSAATTATHSFLVSVSRPQHCLDAEMASLCPSTHDLAHGEKFVFFARAHLNPSTATMPNGTQLIPWRLLKFRRTVVPS